MANRRFTSPNRVPSSLGLAQHRGRKGVSLEEIAESTKISIRFLRAIESEDFGALPGGIFNVSYIRQYAHAVGYDADRLLQHYHALLGEDSGDVVRLAPVGPASETGRGWSRQWFRAIGSLRL